MAIDKTHLEACVYNLNSFLKQESFYAPYMEGIVKGKNTYTMSQRFKKKIFDLDWVEAVEDAVIALDTIVRNPRKFIQQEEDIVDISLARSISTESVKHLAQHTNFISSVDKNGMVIPSKILNISKEESFEIYENRFIYTLILKVHQFLTKRWEMIKQASSDSDTFSVKVSTDYQVGDSKIKCNMDTVLHMPIDAVLKDETAELTDFQRVQKMVQIVNGFLSSPFAKVMVSCALVRPPIIRTNVILKDPNFKKALVLWQFIDTYGQVGFDVKNVDATEPLPPAAVEKYNNLVLLNNIILETLVRGKVGDVEETPEEQKKKQKDLEAEYITKNIDDFVPDDFPQLKLSLFETRRIFTKIPMVSDVTREETAKINKCIDRVLLQHKINVAKQDAENQLRLERLLEQQEIKAKMDALKEAKALERKRIADEKRAEKEHARQEKLNKKLEKDRLYREQLEREERIRREEEEATRQRIAAEKAEAKERILEEQARLKAIYDAEKARCEIEKAQLREQLEREKAQQYIEPLENDAMLHLRKSEQAKLAQMRANQELALKRMITAHYQDMEAQQKQAIIDMEELAELLKYDIFDDLDKEPEDKKEEPSNTEEKTEESVEIIPDVPEADLSLTDVDETGVSRYEREQGFVQDETPEPEPEEEVEDKKESTGEFSFAPRSAEERLAELEKDEVGVSDDDLKDVKAPSATKIRPATATISFEDELGFDDAELEAMVARNAAKREEESKKVESDVVDTEPKSVVVKHTPTASTEPKPRTFIPRSYTTINVTADNVKEVINNPKVAGNEDAEEKTKKKGLFGRKKK